MSKHYNNLFKEGKIGSKTVKNRIILSPMGEEMSNENGALSKESIAYYKERAKGGAGIIMTGATCVDFPQGSGLLAQLALDSREHIEGFKKLADIVHEEGALLMPQLYHAGIVTSMVKTKGKPIKVVSHVKMLAKSMVTDYDAATIQELTTAEIKEIVQKFVQSAKYAKEAGCDGVGIHGGHAYLVNQFFAKAFNKRKDEYGGKLENRMRFAVEVVEGIKKACGKDFCIIFRLPAKDFIPLGLGLSEKTVQVIVTRLTQAGVDLFDLTGGIDPTNKQSMCVEPQGFKEGFRAHLAKPIKAISKVPVSTVGVLRDPQMCDDLIKEGCVDFVTLGRALICDPYWPQKAKEGNAESIRKCISCNEGCFSPIIMNIHKPVTCALNPKVSREYLYADIKKVDQPKQIIVIGAGPAGMQAALTANEKGHCVTLIEKSNNLGGQLEIAAVPPGKELMKDAIKWYAREIERSPINVLLNTEATIDNIKELAPSHVIIATGATPFTPPIKGIQLAKSSWDILNGTIEMPKGKRIVIIGGGIVGAETAHFMAEHGNKVTVIEMNEVIAPGMEPYNKTTMMRHLKSLKVKMITKAQVAEILEGTVYYNYNGKNKKVKADYVITALGQRPFGQDLLQKIKNEGIEVTPIGDMTKVSKIITATEAGFLAAIEL